MIWETQGPPGMVGKDALGNRAARGSLGTLDSRAPQDLQGTLDSRARPDRRAFVESLVETGRLVALDR